MRKRSTAARSGSGGSGVRSSASARRCSTSSISAIVSSKVRSPVRIAITRERSGPQVAQLLTQLRLDEHELVGDEQEQQDRGVALEREPDVLAQAVGDEVEVARSGPHAFRLRPLDVVLEPILPAADTTRSGKPKQI